jgi:hypothetical protein
MPDPIRDLGRKLLRQGVSRRHVARIVRELGEHRDDLEAEGRAAGQSPDAARSAACEKLGNINAPGGELVATRRRSYWCGRHPLISFVLAPLPMFFLLFLGILWLWGEASGLIAWTEHQEEGLPMPDWAAVRVGFYAALCMALTISAGFICLLARRCCCGLKWTLIGCSVFFGQALFLHTGFTPPRGVPGHGNFWIGYGIGRLNRPELIACVVPLVLFILYCFAVRRAQLRSEHS